MNLPSNPRAVAGHNAPPAEAVILERVDARIAAANLWLTALPKVRNAEGKEVTVIQDEDTANACRDFIGQIELELGALPAECTAARKPHDDLAAPYLREAHAIQAKFDAAETKLTLAKLLLKGGTDKKKVRHTGIIQSWLDLLARRKDEAVKKAAADAAQAVAAATEAARKAGEAKGDVIGNQIAAEQAAEQAVAAVETARKAALAKVNIQGDMSARAISYRTYYSATVTDHKQTVRHYRDHVEMLALVQKLANADARAMQEAFDVPGCEIKIERRAA